MILDVATGNVNFGYTGGIVAYPLAASTGSLDGYVCPTGQIFCSTASVCGAGGAGDECVTGNCCSSADCDGGVCQNNTCIGTGCNGDAAACAPITNATATCNGDGTCSYTCNAPFANCTNNIPTVGCNVDTQTDINNCGGCGLACSGTNIPNPVCQSVGGTGTCTGHCADGWVDCDSNRQANGCETAATCGACCTGACGAGDICYDQNGGTAVANSAANGVCTALPASVESYPQATVKATQGDFASLACPSGQPINAIIFADYGTPFGTAAQSWENPCSNIPGVDSNRTKAQNTTACAAVSGCVYNAAVGVCIPSVCNGVAQASCTGACAWDTGAATCVGATGFAHEYNTAPNNKLSDGICALDVSLKTSITTGCGLAGGSAMNSCGVNAINENWPNTTNLHTPVGTDTLPLAEATNWAYACASGNQLWLQASCGACPGTGTPPSKHVFATITTTTGNILFPAGCTVGQTGCNQGVAAANAICASEAAAAGLGGTYLAWISSTGSGGTSPSTWTGSTGEYVLPDDTEVAASITKLRGVHGNPGGAASDLLHSIDEVGCDGQTVDVSGTFEACTAANPVAANSTWTGTLDNGTPAANNCANWTSSTTTGQVGNANGRATGWSGTGAGANSAVSCSSSYNLYCVEQ
jgi:hypothetical protein